MSHCFPASVFWEVWCWCGGLFLFFVVFFKKICSLFFCCLKVMGFIFLYLWNLESLPGSLLCVCVCMSWSCLGLICWVLSSWRVKSPFRGRKFSHACIYYFSDQCFATLGIPITHSQSLVIRQWHRQEKSLYSHTSLCDRSCTEKLQCLKPSVSWRKKPGNSNICPRVPSRDGGRVLLGYFSSVEATLAGSFSSKNNSILGTPFDSTLFFYF